MVCRARFAYISPCFNFHTQCQGLSRTTKRHSVIPSEYDACKSRILTSTEMANVYFFSQVHPRIILSGTGEKLHAKGTEDKYIDYLRYLEKSSLHTRRAQEADTIENYAQGYYDYLQMPLQVSFIPELLNVREVCLSQLAEQPLQDHLASMVYENFERDPVKYQKYEEVISQY